MGQEVSILLLALLCLGFVYCYPSAPSKIEEQLHKNLRQNKHVQVCGQRLSAIISSVCQGNYNTIESAQSPTVYPFRSRQEALGLIKSRRRKREGISDECCKKPCSYAELKTFCSN